jgi:hypothetical protein
MPFNALIPRTYRSQPEFLPGSGLSTKARTTRGQVCLFEPWGSPLRLEQFHPCGWNLAALEPPLGRGINLQTEVDETGSMLDTLKTMTYSLYRSPGELWPRMGNLQIGEREFLVQDPLRLSAVVFAILWSTEC